MNIRLTKDEVENLYDCIYKTVEDFGFGGNFDVLIPLTARLVAKVTNFFEALEITDEKKP